MSLPSLEERLDFIIKNENNAGSGDTSACLISWMKTFNSAFHNNKEVTLSPNDSCRLLHTLLCYKIRLEKIVTERDELKLKLLESSL